MIPALWPEQNNARAKKNANAADVGIPSTRHVVENEYKGPLTSSKEISDECMSVKQTRGDTVLKSPGAEEKHSTSDNQYTNGGEGQSARLKCAIKTRTFTHAELIVTAKPIRLAIKSTRE